MFNLTPFIKTNYNFSYPENSFKCIIPDFRQSEVKFTNLADHLVLRTFIEHLKDSCLE
jgi:hypothetical protein